MCPFHDDINPSMEIILSEGFFKCYGCQESGNALKFVTLVNRKNMDELEACKEYFKILKSKKVKRIKFKPRKHKAIQDNVQALNEAHDYYYGLKTNNWKEKSPEREYMSERGFHASTLEKCKAKINYNLAYPLIFPMYDLGEFRGWVCRTMSPQIEKRRKYLYNEGFLRNNTLVGDYDSEVVVLVEGYMDRLKMVQYGAKKVVAILGWKITDNQIQKLKDQGVKYIISALDNDECGNKGTKYLKQYFPVIRFQFPDGCKDPGEMNREQYQIANKETKRLFREAKQNGIIRRYQKSGEKIR